MSLLPWDDDTVTPSDFTGPAPDPDLTDPGLTDPFSLSGSVGRFGDNDRSDVIKAQVLFGNTGDYDLAALGAPTGWPGGELDQAMRRYQKQRGLAVDGLMLPAGETLQALQGELGKSLQGYAVPTPDEVDRYYEGRNRLEPDGPLPAIVTADKREGHPLGVMRPAPMVVSDVDDAAPAPLWQAGAQLAQAPPAVATRPAPPVAAEAPVVKTRVFSDKAIPLPSSKASTFDLPENKGAWDGFQAGLAEQLSGSPVRRAAYSDIYAAEGGRLVDPKSGAVGGITPETLEDMRRRGKLPELPAKLKPEDLTPGQQVQVMDAYINDVMHTSGGAAALEKLNPALATAVADTLYADGRAKGAEFLQAAINKAGGKVDTDGKMGPQVFGALEALNRDPQARDNLLSAIANARIQGKPRSPGEIVRIDRLRPKPQPGN